MGHVSLLNSTGVENIDRVLQGTIGVFETAFPDRIRAYYVEGSYADQSDICASDVDMSIVFKETFADEGERGRARQLIESCAFLSPVELDVEITDEQTLSSDAQPSLMKGGLAVYGEDIRSRSRVMSLDAWTRDRMHSSYWRIAKLFNRPAIVVHPLDYPDPADEFYGYLWRQVRSANGQMVRSTKDLIRSTSWAATAIIAQEAGRYVASKKDCYTSYKRYINDEWAQLLEDLYALCRVEWNYAIPAGRRERKQLRELCAQVLAFENHFLTVYKRFLLSELQHADTTSQAFAVWLLGTIIYYDDEIVAAVRALAHSGDEQLRQAVQQTLRAFQNVTVSRER